MSNRTAVEDLAGKRSLLQRYRSNWARELRADVPAATRSKIANDLTLLASVDEDLLRLEKILKSSPTWSQEENDRLRDSIVAYIGSYGAPVSMQQLCEHFDRPSDRIRNLLRGPRGMGRVLAVEGGYVSGQDVAGPKILQMAMMESIS